MAKKRKLQDLYVVGKELIFDDGEGDPITVFLRKMTPIQYETALRLANAARARMLAARNDQDGDDYQSLNGLVLEYDRDTLLSYLTADLRQDKRPVIEERLGAEDEWTDNDYLQGLKDAWQDLQWAHAKDPEDPDAKRVFDEFKRFDAQIEAELDAEVDDFVEAMSDQGMDALREKVMEKVLDVQGSIAWLAEYRRCEVWMATRDVDHKTPYFDSRKEVDELPREIFQRLSEEYQALTVEPTEGKDSGATPDSSPSSAQPDEPEAAAPSGPVNAAA
jgi:hypothetical protein